MPVVRTPVKNNPSYEGSRPTTAAHISGAEGRAGEIMDKDGGPSHLNPPKNVH